MAAKYNTRKSTPQARRITIARKAIRAAKRQGVTR